MMKSKSIILKVFLAAAVVSLFCADSSAADIELSKGQYVYVPAYSHIYSGDFEHQMLLAVTLSVRNTDMKNSIKVLSVDYYDTKGKRIRKFIKGPVVLKALESSRYVIRQSDTAGGSGANFIVRWVSDKAVNPPIIESIMIGTQSQQGLSFTSRGRAVLVQKD